MKKITLVFLFGFLLSIFAPGNELPAHIRVSEAAANKLITFRVQPVYPPDVCIEGHVVMRVVIAKSGSVTSVEAVNGHPMLVGPAIDAVKQWRYQQFFLNGQPVEIETHATVMFRPPQPCPANHERS